MIGYKIAVGIDRKNGPFPAMVTLNIPDDATVIRPTKPIKLGLYGGSIKSNNLINIYELRTDKATVLDVRPVDEYKEKVEDWNGKAYSVYLMNHYAGLSKYINYFSYQKGEELFTDLCMDDSIVCAQGIHFFLTEHDANNYLLLDENYYIMSSLYDFDVWWKNRYNKFYPVCDLSTYCLKELSL